MLLKCKISQAMNIAYIFIIIVFIINLQINLNCVILLILAYPFKINKKYTLRTLHSMYTNSFRIESHSWVLHHYSKYHLYLIIIIEFDFMLMTILYDEIYINE